MMSLYIQAFRKYAVFSGRASRSEYWSFVLIHIPILIGSYLLLLRSIDFPDFIEGMIGIVSIYYIATPIPWLALTVRRLHDTGRSAWWLLIPFVTFGFGWLVLLVFMCLRSEPQANKYGMPYSKTEATNANYYRVERRGD